MKSLENAQGKKTKIIITAPKSCGSERVIPLNDYALALCRRHFTADPAAFVLTGDAGRYVEPRTMQNRLKRYAEECGLSEVHFHALRHTFATRCVEVGFEIKSLSEILDTPARASRWKVCARLAGFETRQYEQAGGHRILAFIAVGRRRQALPHVGRRSVRARRAAE